MSFEFIGNPTLTLKYSDPNLLADDIGVQSAQWRGNATVRVKNEHGKKWRIGFAQLLEKNMMMAVYTKTKRSEVLIPPASMPVLDADDNPDWRPFYDDDGNGLANQPKDVQTTPGHPQVDTAIRMWDEPESHYDWWHNDDATDPLREFIMSLTFSTYIIARDITNGAGINDPFVVRILKQWDVVLDRRYEFQVVKNTSQPGLKADLLKTKCLIKNPMRQPFVKERHQHEFPKNPEFIFKGKVANDVFTDQDDSIKTKTVGEFVKSRAAMFGGVK